MKVPVIGEKGAVLGNFHSDPDCLSQGLKVLRFKFQSFPQAAQAQYQRISMVKYYVIGKENGHEMSLVVNIKHFYGSPGKDPSIFAIVVC